MVLTEPYNFVFGCSFFTHRWLNFLASATWFLAFVYSLYDTSPAAAPSSCTADFISTWHFSKARRSTLPSPPDPIDLSMLAETSVAFPLAILTNLTMKESLAPISSGKSFLRVSEQSLVLLTLGQISLTMSEYLVAFSKGKKERKIKKDRATATLLVMMGFIIFASTC
uniref:Uncharacterized protein n=1 Tax=Gossypium raimondii TaxID=29730 RepID=A0A0D2RF96_GOSRA|nr:hypothetical protein B456_008G144000 [Gossypium raimondii]